MSWKSLLLPALLAGSLGLRPAEVAAQKKPANPSTPPTKATPQDYAQLRNQKQLGGSVYYVEAGTGTVTLRVSIPHLERNPNYRPPRIMPIQNSSNYNRYHHNYGSNRSGYNPQQHMASMMNRYQQIMRERNPIQREQQLMQLSMQMQQMEAQAMMQFQMQGARMEMQQMQQMARVMQQVAQASGNPNNQPFKVVNAQKDFDLVIQDKAAIRKMYVGTEFDDMGNARQYTKAELAELKGKDSSLPGYAAKLEDLQPGQDVVLYLTPPKTAGAKKAGDLDNPLGVAAANPDRPSVRMVVMLHEQTTAAVAVPAKKK